MSKIRAHIPLANLKQEHILRIAKHFSTGPGLFTVSALEEVNWNKHRTRKATLLRLVSSTLARADTSRSPKTKHYTDSTHYFLGSDTEGRIVIVVADNDASFEDFVMYEGSLAGLRNWLMACGIQRDNLPVPLHEVMPHLQLPTWVDYFESLDETAMRLAREGDCSAIHQMISTYVDVYNNGSVIEQEDYSRAWEILLAKHPELGQAYKDRVRERNTAQNSLTTISSIVKEVSKSLGK